MGYVNPKAPPPKPKPRDYLAEELEAAFTPAEVSAQPETWLARLLKTVKACHRTS